MAPRKAVGVRTTDGPSLRDFMRQQQPSQQTSWLDTVGASYSSEESDAATAAPYLSESDLHGRGRRGEDTQHGGAWWAVPQLTRLLVGCLGSHAWPPEVGLVFCCDVSTVVSHYLPHFPVYFETYGCQMNVNDTEVAWSILRDSGYKLASSPTEVSP